MKLSFVQAGEIVTTHGVRGEVKVLPWLETAEDLCEYKRLKIGETEYKVEKCRVQKNCNLLKLAGVDTMEQAQALRGKVVEIFRQDAPVGVIFADELIGVQVYCEGLHIGNITEVLDYPGNKVYVVQGQRQYMIPAVSAFVLSTDIDNERMEVKLLEGMATDEN